MAVNYGHLSKNNVQITILLYVHLVNVDDGISCIFIFTTDIENCGNVMVQFKF